MNKQEAMFRAAGFSTGGRAAYVTYSITEGVGSFTAKGGLPQAIMLMDSMADTIEVTALFHDEYLIWSSGKSKSDTPQNFFGYCPPTLQESVEMVSLAIEQNRREETPSE